MVDGGPSVIHLSLLLLQLHYLGLLLLHLEPLVGGLSHRLVMAATVMMTMVVVVVMVPVVRRVGAVQAVGRGRGRPALLVGQLVVMVVVVAAARRRVRVLLVQLAPLGVRLVLDEVGDVEEVVVAVPAGQHARHVQVGPAPEELCAGNFTLNFDNCWGSCS